VIAYARVANEVAVIFLSHNPQSNNAGLALTCPVPPAVLEDTAVSTSGRGMAFRLTSDTPITTYDILPYGGARTFLPSASLLLPTSALGTDYHAVAPHDVSDNPVTGGKLWITIVGTQSGTVTIQPETTLPAGPGLGAAPAGQTTTVSIDAGETVQWLSADPTYATTNLVITRRQQGGAFHNVTVGCLGVVTGWEPVGQDGEVEVAHVDLIRGMPPVGQCTGSRHEAHSSGPFGITVWGTDWCASYAYPAGASVRAINSVTFGP